MSTPLQLAIPRPVPTRKPRKPKDNVPQTRPERERALAAVRAYVAEFNPVPPLPVEDLKVHAGRVLAQLQWPEIYRDYIGVLINNESWREQLAAVPYERRLLLLPKCLRVESRCPAPFDEFGLLCKQCGLCTIQDLQAEAEKLGYATLVAEGSAIVMSLIQTGKVEAIVGVSCLPVLERAFPYMEAAAVPGVAIPLLQDDCIDTTVDEEWIWDYIHLTSDDHTRRLDLGRLRDEVAAWFTPESLRTALGEPQGESERIAHEWLARAGKRWRPFLAVAACQALRPQREMAQLEDVKPIALAVECFHKASLIHDDIEDGDALRYGEKTLHAQYGVAVALNVGDLLIGEGYRLIAQCKASAEQRAAMLEVAATGQRELCRGQGAELCWQRSPEPMSTLQVLDIFRKKTAPAFEVALQLGAIHAGLDAHAAVSATLRQYSEALGIAYQIRDDLHDLVDSDAPNDLSAMRPSLLLAVAHERAKDADRELTDALWHRQTPAGYDAAKLAALCRRLKAVERAESLLATYKEEAVRALADLENPNLKGLLRRVIGKIFDETEIKGWCSEVQASELHQVRRQAIA